jgi:hypothetical protein
MIRATPAGTLPALPVSPSTPAEQARLAKPLRPVRRAVVDGDIGSELRGQRRAPAGVDAAEERNVRFRLVAIALDGLRARDGGRPGEILPGDPPSPVRYVNRWSITTRA